MAQKVGYPGGYSGTEGVSSAGSGASPVELLSLYQALGSAHIEVQGIVDTLADPVLLLDQNLCVMRANPAFYGTFDAEPDNTVGVSLFALGKYRDAFLGRLEAPL